ncbi:MAG: alcohol dehydrogenase catalytic domain-containing protein [Spirochaetia bacterium]|nr:alcohol dehydrogenase catalytic domain-containing protein [Spirochaetia bacterium]
MKSAVLEDAQRLVIRELPKPELKPGEILIRVKFCGICTLEQRLYRGDMKIYYPIIPGHEVSGEVAEIGDGVITPLKTGDRVAVDMVYRCHECYFCRTGQSNLCENRFNRSIKPLGGFSEYVAVKPNQVHLIGDNLPLDEAAFSEPVACCIRSLKKLQVTIAEDVLIAGAGPMGLMHLQVALAMGARVFVSDIDGERLRAALAMGADGVFNPIDDDITVELKKLTGGRGVDACVVTSPALPALDTAFQAIRKNGRINIYTAYMQDKPVMPIDMNTLHRNEVLVTGTEGRTEIDFQQAVRLLSFGRVKVKPLISQVVSFENLAEGITAAMSSDTQRVLLGTLEGELPEPAEDSSL